LSLPAFQPYILVWDIEHFRKERLMPKLTYLGHSAFLVEGQKGSVIIDPFLSGNPLARAKPEEIQVDYVLLSHGHGDHLGDALQIAKRCDATIVAPNELAVYCRASPRWSPCPWLRRT
jgi:L-ascorbate metabolism protein UlaG (beta-lactamase superfamily)